MVSNSCKSSPKLYLSPSLFEIVLEQIQDGASRTSLTLFESDGGETARLVDNIDLDHCWIQRQTYISYEPIDFAWNKD